MTPDKWFKFSSNSDNLTMLGNLFPGATVENNRSLQDHSLGLVHGPFKTYRLEIIKHMWCIWNSRRNLITNFNNNEHDWCYPNMFIKSSWPQEDAYDMILYTSLQFVYFQINVDVSMLLLSFFQLPHLTGIDSWSARLTSRGERWS